VATENVGYLRPEGQESSRGEVEGRDDPVELLYLVWAVMATVSQEYLFKL